MIDPDEDWARQSVIDAGLDLERTGLSPQQSGNVSIRFRDGMLITPTGMSYSDLLPGDIVWMGLDGRTSAGARAPSSEWQMHAAIYAARAEAEAIVHAHSDFAVTLAVMKRDIPPFHYMVALLGGRDIRCAPYATFGSAELAQHAVTALQSRKACLLAHHGQIALGRDIGEALKLAHEVETLAGQYWRALQIGEPELLDDEEMRRVAEKFGSYGQAGRG
ncbi:MAG: class II aldolase/adducin family protein [Parvibaculum sp.]|uniref:class II aldolase/adducin family protein n=1 Tax=Parvibaculum sp. TaxID=2024848 RepID=UPI0025DFE375|nr:class II aldolase/adducin family protein [Parvibaculum sp.]MCE9649480.1 class II aldolase/adducin family protein [Parvibaculum sp.]